MNDLTEILVSLSVFVLRIWRWCIGDWWVVRRGAWPYHGWCTYNRYRNTILDTGITEKRAKEIRREMNS